MWWMTRRSVPFFSPPWSSVVLSAPLLPRKDPAPPPQLGCGSRSRGYFLMIWKIFCRGDAIPSRNRKRPSPHRAGPGHCPLQSACRPLGSGAPSYAGGKHDNPERKQKNIGRVYLVGAGCGSADLITVRGTDLLKTCDAVVYDELLDPALLEASFQAEKYPMGKRKGRHSAHQEERLTCSSFLLHRKE